jgi:nondiscriminating aspartyl-tRNA synthetase
VTLKKGVADAALFSLLGETPRESVIEVVGTVQTSAKSHRGVELLPSSAQVVTRAESPLPLGVVDKVGADLPTRLDHRVLDLRKPAVRAVFELRSDLLEAFRAALRHRGFLEVETPKILREGAEGGATLFSVDYFGQRAFLAQSPQLYKQMLIGAGFERVLELGPVFRAEPSDTVRHVTEIGMLDAEIAFIEGAEDLRQILEEVLVEVLRALKRSLEGRGNPLAEGVPSVTAPFPRIPFSTAMEWLGKPGVEDDLGTEDEKALGERTTRELGSPFYFITDFPTAVKARTFYAQRQDANPKLTGYFDLYFRDLEITSGGPREHRYERLVENIRGAGLEPELFPGYLEAFRYGMPPHGGWGLGLDRLVQGLARLSNIREARLFPRDRYRLEP